MDNQNTNLTEGQNQEGKTFTQDDVNRIVGERLAKEKANSEKAIQQREQELNKRELDLKAKEILSTKGLPLDILEALNYSDEDSLNKSISIIEKQIKKEEPVKVTGREPYNGTNIVNGKTVLDPIKKAFGL
jgi:hypothetical protein